MRLLPSSSFPIITNPLPSFLLCVLLNLVFIKKSAPYPIISDINPGYEDKCFTYTIPEHDDVHLVFLAIPSLESNEIEAHYVDAIHSLSKDGGENMLGELPSLPDHLEKEISDKDGKTGLVALVSNIRDEKGRRDRPHFLHYHVPLIMRHVTRHVNRKDRVSLALDGMMICFEGMKMEQEVTVIFDVVLVSDDSHDKVNEKLEKKISQKEELTPVQDNLRLSIRAASRVLAEMGTVSQREYLMRQGADKRNRGVTFFSYLSIGILLATAWLQITYLKSYFRKKKLM
mmetsp:Transcript_25278/g.30573  ORF Transcript_25278/g.30573 Transcript_25278/m.30573 type:complete len:286 (-) Transcript_25278:225-1082(-)|eukprot:CAMPEP_0172517324 /NCGR_PEP_ID=MMETSP1066-20121228/284311_1 /TAXON_ID=671091 /ORGANISM="Coscinodiscus wailesii, Strain CCMP2513" /LENGTH=285 /DNA_ID=CAMNT_0013299277 /DNA_START=163 /DNA_END=1020 /DNA_ORIENTATION=-